MSAKPKLSGKASALQVVAQAVLPTRFGRFTIYGVRGRDSQEEVVALVRGRITRQSTPVVRVHSQCLTGDVLTSLRCDCRAQLELALRQISRARCGVFLYLPQEGRGIGLMNKLRAYELQDRGMDTVEANKRLGFAADARDYRFSALVLRALGVTRVHLLSNNPDKVEQLERFGVRVIKRIPCQPRVPRVAQSYLRTKQSKMGHLLDAI
jgi:GTP cyclohydrolase II